MSRPRAKRILRVTPFPTASRQQGLLIKVGVLYLGRDGRLPLVAHLVDIRSERGMQKRPIFF
jgi:hypothetical protein